LDEKELIEKLCAGSENAFRYLLDQHQQRIFRACLGFLHNKEDAEDVTQEVFVQVYKSIGNFKGDSALSSWLYRIAVNKSLNFIKEKNSNGFFGTIKDALGISGASTPHSELEKKETENLLLKAIENLPEKQRIAFTLAKYEHLSYKDVAEIMQTSVSSVESLLFRAKNNLLQSLKK
jgi:RNA polymerase sigma-70 factor, ECF subfamily